MIRGCVNFPAAADSDVSNDGWFASRSLVWPRGSGLFVGTVCGTVGGKAVVQFLPDIAKWLATLKLPFP